MHFGNGTKSNDTYDPDTRWLDALSTQNSWDQNLQNLEYSFDNVGNITSRINRTDAGDTEQNYSYDALYQITESSGSYNHHPSQMHAWNNSYQQSYSYDTLGNMTSKISSQTRDIPSSTPKPLEYSLDVSSKINFPENAKKIPQYRVGNSVTAG